MSKANDVRDSAGIADAIAELAIEVAATANPTVRAKARRVITGHVVE